MIDQDVFIAVSMISLWDYSVVTLTSVSTKNKHTKNF